MKREKKFKWYNLPEEVREQLLKTSEGFYILKDYGMWLIPPAGYEQEAIAILRTHATLSYDIFIPTLVKMMNDGVLTAIFPIGMMVMDIVFFNFDDHNPFHYNAYQRAGLGGIIKALEEKK